MMQPLDSPSLALIHGWGLGRAAWQPIVTAVSACCNVHHVDLPGYGDAAPDLCSFEDTARRIVDSLPAGMILCGWSLGALLAMQAALLAPERVAGLVLVGATPCFTRHDGWADAQPTALLNDFAAAVANDGRTTLQRFVALFNQGDAKARPIGRDIARNVLSSPLPATSTLLAGLDWLRDTDLRERVEALSCPLLLIHGERDPLMPLPASRWLADRLPQARLEVFADAAHAPFLNDPGRFAHLVGDFLHASRID